VLRVGVKSVYIIILNTLKFLLFLIIGLWPPYCCSLFIQEDNAKLGRSLPQAALIRLSTIVIENSHAMNMYL